MNSENNRDQSGESNAGAGMNNNSREAVRKGVRKNASHPGDASNAAGMRSGGPEAPDGPAGSPSRDDAGRQPGR